MTRTAGRALAGFASVFIWSTPLPAQPKPGAPLAGRWTAVLQTGNSTGTGSISGTVVLIAVGGTDRPSYRGSYRIPFSTVGLGPDAAPVQATTLRGDSVQIVLNPSVRTGYAELRGVWSRGGIEGEWRWIGGPGGGRFELRPAGRD